MSSAPPNARREAARRALALEDAHLLLECDEVFFRAGGPGGQHRNKASTGVRLTHRPTEVTVTATERRSQAQNRQVALERLRAALERLTRVKKVRRPTQPSRGAKERRLEAKRRQSARKERRRPDRW